MRKYEKNNIEEKLIIYEEETDWRKKQDVGRKVQDVERKVAQDVGRKVQDV